MQLWWFGPIHTAQAWHITRSTSLRIDGCKAHARRDAWDAIQPHVHERVCGTLQHDLGEQGVLKPVDGAPCGAHSGWIRMRLPAEPLQHKPPPEQVIIGCHPACMMTGAQCM